MLCRGNVFIVTTERLKRIQMKHSWQTGSG